MKHLTEKVVRPLRLQGTWNCRDQGNLSEDAKILITIWTYTKYFHIISTLWVRFLNSTLLQMRKQSPREVQWLVRVCTAIKGKAKIQTKVYLVPGLEGKDQKSVEVGINLSSLSCSSIFLSPPKISSSVPCLAFLISFFFLLCFCLQSPYHCSTSVNIFNLYWLDLYSLPRFAL